MNSESRFRDTHQAGQAAVKLLKKLAQRDSLSSDSKLIQDEISRIEKFFNEEATESALSRNEFKDRA